MTMFDDNFLMTIFEDNFLMTTFEDIETIFDNWKDSPGGYFSIVDHFSKKILSELVQIRYSIRIGFLQNLVQIENRI